MVTLATVSGDRVRVADEVRGFAGRPATAGCRPALSEEFRLGPPPSDGSRSAPRAGKRGPTTTGWLTAPDRLSCGPGPTISLASVGTSALDGHLGSHVPGVQRFTIQGNVHLSQVVK